MCVDVDSRGLKCLKIAADTPGMERDQPQFIDEVVAQFFQGLAIADPFQDLQDFVLTNQLLITGHEFYSGLNALIF